MATSMRLNIRRRTAVATATGLPRYARNDNVGTHDGYGEVADWGAVRVRPTHWTTGIFWPEPAPVGGFLATLAGRGYIGRKSGCCED